MKLLAKVHVTLKPGVNDPQGQAIRGGLHTLGFGGVVEVRSGRHQWVHIRMENEHTPLTRAYERVQVVTCPISHGDGSYFADAETLASIRYSGPTIPFDGGALLSAS